MINTIFYFPESLTFDQYLDALNSNTDDGIASRTIVFAKQQGKIYNNGKIYGTTYSDVQNLIEQNRYDDEEVRAAIEQLKRDLQSESEAIDLQGQRYLALAGRVKTVEDHGYVNESEILTAVAGEIDGSTQKSSIRNKVNNVAKEASAALFTEVSDQNDNITAQSIVNAITSNSTAKANLASSFNSGDNTMWANVVTQTDLNSATSALYAALQNKANDSEVVKKASIIASINSSGESNVSINADKIQLNGTAVANCLMAAQAVLGGFTIENSKLSNSAVEFNADGSGYLAAGAIKWTSAGALDINADGLLLDVEHPWTWAQWFGNNTPVKGLAAFGIVGDYSNLKYKASYNFDTNEFIYTSALTDPDADLPSDPKEATRTMANGFSSAIFDASGFGIGLLNPKAIDVQHLQDEVSQYTGATGTSLIEMGTNQIHPHANLHAVLFDHRYHSIAKECTSGLHIDNHTDIGGSLLVEKNVHVPDGDVTAESFKIYGGTSAQFLKADGSVATLKTINGNSLEGTGDIVISDGGSGNYLPLTGGQLTGDLTVYNSNAQVVSVSGKTADTTSLAGGSITIETATSGTPLKAKSCLDHDQLYFSNQDVKGTSITYNSVTSGSFIKSGGTSSQFLKADGSVDSNTYLPVVNGTVSVSPGNMDVYSSEQPGDITTVFDAKSSQKVVFEGGSTYYFDNSVQAGSFVKLNATSDEVLMADGSTMTLAQLKAALDAI